MTAVPRTIHDLPTPALILDKRRLEANAARMRERIARHGVRLRPHVKTSKSIDVARILAGGEPAAITVSTLAEARYFFGHGVRDILYAVGIAPVKLQQVAELIRGGCTLRIILDTVEAARAVNAFGQANDLRIEALIEVDTDGHRAGVTPDDPLLLDIAQALEAGGGGRLAGVMTHAGDSYGCRSTSDFEAIAERERALTVRAAERLRDAGYDCPIVSVGSTPTAYYSTRMDGITEVRCGVYAFGDLVQAGLGTCAVDDIAIGVLGTVISHKPSHGRILIDAGFLALSRDRGTSAFPDDWDYGAVVDASTGELCRGLTVSSTNQEHGIITAKDGPIDVGRLPVGSRVKILPNHACATAAAYDRYYVVEGGDAIVDVWERINGW